jgi:type IV pilus assembly protein PilA
MNELSGRSDLEGARAHGETREAETGEYRFAYLGGMDFAIASSRKLRISRAFAWILAIIAFLLIGLMRVGWVVPNHNELAAIQSIRAIRQAQAEYKSTYPRIGYACSLTALAGDPASGAPNPQHAQILQGEITKGIKNGYILRILGCTMDPTHQTNQITGFTVTAVPEFVGKTGKRGFCADTEGPIRFDPAGGTNCTQEVQ